MNDLNGYERFEKLMAEFMPQFLEPVAKQKLENPDFFDEQLVFEYVIFNGFNEISNSINTLQLIEKFISITPPDEEGINYSNYLIYHVHNYLQEMYILKERLKTYSKVIKRKYSKAINEKLLNMAVTSLMDIIITALDNICGTNGIRNKHVHAEKFKDNELTWLSSTIFLANFNNEFKIQSVIAYQTAKNKWFQIVKNNNEEIYKLIDMYFNTIYTIISVDDKVVLPHEYIRLTNKT